MIRGGAPELPVNLLTPSTQKMSMIHQDNDSLAGLRFLFSLVQ